MESSSGKSLRSLCKVTGKESAKVVIPPLAPKKGQIGLERSFVMENAAKNGDRSGFDIRESLEFWEERV
jgi:hypothetical protein